MEVRQLQHFLAAAREGSLRAAAAALGVSQPALTKSLRRLELALGAPLFERHPRGISLNPFGEAFVPHARTLEAELRHAAATMRGLRDTARGLVRVGAGPSMAAALLPEVAARLQRDGAAVQMQIRSALNDSLLKELAANELDMAITTMPSVPVAAELQHERLFSDRVVVTARCGHPLASAGARLSDLAGARWVLPNGDVLTRVRITRTMLRNGLPAPDVWIETDSIPFMLEVVSRTDLLGYVPEQLIAGRALQRVAVPGTVWRRDVAVSYRRHRTFTPGCRRFLEALREVCAGRLIRPS